MDHPLPSLPPGKDENQIAEEAIEWFSRLRMSTVTSKDLETFERWCEAHPSHRQVYDRVAAMWEHPGMGIAASRAGPPSRDRMLRAPVRWQTVTAIAASLVIVIMVAIQWDLVTRAQADYYTGVGEQTTVRLSDQSMVTLNTQTAIAVEYHTGLRTIRLLKGQASFKVMPDPSRPFVVEHHGIRTRAVGTEFMVREVSGGAQVTVAEGQVTVSKPGASWLEIPLDAGREVLADGGAGGKPYNVDVAMATAWLHGRLVVTAARLDEVLKEVGRYYPGTIIIWNQELEHIRVTGTYNLNDPAKLLVTLSKTFSFHTVSLADRMAVLY
ncbi:MAG: FecR family protein [Nitrospira sp.]